MYDKIKIKFKYFMPTLIPCTISLCSIVSTALSSTQLWYKNVAPTYPAVGNFLAKIQVLSD